MNAPSLELCKELYNLSGWDKTYLVWAVANEGDYAPWLRPGVGNNSAYTELPAYDLGYLLRKIQVAFGVSIKYVDPDNPSATDLKDWYGRWVCYTPWLKQKHYAYATTPEDAAAKLAIELLKVEVLTKDQN